MTLIILLLLLLMNKKFKIIKDNINIHILKDMIRKIFMYIYVYTSYFSVIAPKNIHRNDYSKYIKHFISHYKN